MRAGAAISGGLHTGFLALVVWGGEWFKGPETPPLLLTEIEMVDGIDFDAAISAAPYVVSDGPGDLSAPPSADAGLVSLWDESADLPVALPAAPDLATAPEADATPRTPDIAVPPAPRHVPTEDLRPTIAEISSPDPLDRKALVPESPVATEPVQPLAPRPSQEPVTRPSPPPQAEPEPEQPVETADSTQHTPDTDTKPDPEPTDAFASESPKEEMPEAEDGPAPQMAAMPTPRPADFAASDLASSAQEQPSASEQQRAERDDARASATSQQNTGRGNKRRGPKLSDGEVDALKVALRGEFNFTGDRSDQRLAVLLRLTLAPNGDVTRFEVVKLQGSTSSDATRNALAKAAANAVKKANNKGKFGVLPRTKYDRWQTLDLVFTPNGLRGVES